MAEKEKTSATIGDARRRSIVLIGGLVPIAVLGLLLVYGLQLPANVAQQALAAITMAAIAALVVGSLMGFLFGIPRALQRNSESSADRGSTTYEANTNLEQISDWLTKILVGVGIAQFAAIARAVGAVIGQLSSTMGGDAKANIMAAALIIFYSVWGFLVGYLLTRTYLPGLFRASDAEEITMMAAEKAAEVAAKTVEDLDAKQDAIDARAYGLAARLISPSTSGQASLTRSKDLERFRQELPEVSRATREQIYHMAQTQRRGNWAWRTSLDRADEKRELHDRTIDVLSALADVDRDSAMVHGDLGFALKDKQVPDVDGAVKALGRAVELADYAGYRVTADWYAVNRALALIYNWDKLTPERRDRERAAVLADLQRAQHSLGQPKKVLDEDEVQQWVRREGLTEHLSGPGPVGTSRTDAQMAGTPAP